jgi:hypothetical protein
MNRAGLISLEQAAYLLDIASSTLTKWRRTKRLPEKCVVRVSAGKHMYIESEIIKASDQDDIYNPALWREKKGVKVCS